MLRSWNVQSTWRKHADRLSKDGGKMWQVFKETTVHVVQSAASNFPRVELNYVEEPSARTTKTNTRRNRTSVSEIFSIQPSRASFNGVRIQRGNFPKRCTNIWNLNAREFVGFAKNPYETSTKKNEESSSVRDGEKKRERWKKKGIASEHWLYIINSSLHTEFRS